MIVPFADCVAGVVISLSTPKPCFVPFMNKVPIYFIV